MTFFFFYNEYLCFVHSYLRVLKHVNISRTEYFLRGCVLSSLEKDVGCSMDDVERVIKRDEVRQGLLDSISLDYCGKTFLIHSQSPHHIQVR